MSERIPRSLRARAAFGVAMVLVAFAAASPRASAQCAFLGTPGVTCSDGSLTPATTISCGSAPSAGNANFWIFGGSIWGTLGGPALLAVGGCASVPFPIPGGPPCASFQSGCICAANPPGCFGYVDLSSLAAVLIGSPGPAWHLPIPNDPFLVGQTFCAQGFQDVPGFAGSHCIHVTHGLSITIE